MRRRRAAYPLPSLCIRRPTLLLQTTPRLLIPCLPLPLVKAFGKLALAYGFFCATAIAAFAAIQRGLWAPGGSGLLGIWAVYIWFQFFRVGAFTALGGLLPHWGKRSRAEGVAAVAR